MMAQSRGGNPMPVGPNRRAFVAGLGSAAAWPVAVRAQQPDRVRRIGVLMPLTADDPLSKSELEAFLKKLQELGWIEGRNAQIDARWDVSEANTDASRKSVADLLALAPDVILAVGSPSVGRLLEATRAVPIVFVRVTDPVGAGFVNSLAQPGGNATGFALSEYSLSGKWLELLKEIAPGVKRVAVFRDPAVAAGAGAFAAIQSMAPSLGVEVSPINVRDPIEIERAVAAFANNPNSGLITTRSALALRHRELIVMLAARHKLPAVYYDRPFATSGGLISYGPDVADQYRRAAGYVDRILKGEKPADLPIQQPTKFELVINLKTAKAIGLEVPPSLLARADEVIE
jgi:putative ABC transport system substrate-binding protein